MSKYLTVKYFRSSILETCHAPVSWALLMYLAETVPNEMDPWVGAWVQANMLRGWPSALSSSVALGLEG